MNSYVYEHWRLDLNLPFYVGKGKGRRAWAFSDRSKYHRILVAEIGRQNVEIRIIEDNLAPELASRLEIERISFWRDRGVLLVNRSNGGESGYGAHKGIAFTEEHRSALSAAKVGKKRPAFTAETIDRMRRASVEREARKRRLGTNRQTEEVKKLIVRGNHNRWHVARGIVNPDCAFCA